MHDSRPAGAHDAGGRTSIGEEAMPKFLAHLQVAPGSQRDVTAILRAAVELLRGMAESRDVQMAYVTERVIGAVFVSNRDARGIFEGIVAPGPQFSLRPTNPPGLDSSDTIIILPLENAPAIARNAGPLMRWLADH